MGRVGRRRRCEVGVPDAVGDDNTVQCSIETGPNLPISGTTLVESGIISGQMRYVQA